MIDLIKCSGGFSNLLAHIYLIVAGQTTTLEFDAPAAGTYQFFSKTIVAYIFKVIIV